MIARHVGVEILPDTLDAIGIGAVGRQEMQNDAAAESLQGPLGQESRVNPVVVDDEVDAAGAAVAAGQESEQLAEERGVLARGGE